MAASHGHQILPEFEFSDEAISGTKRQREGLDALLLDAEAGKFKVLYFHSLSRLSRESVITMPIMKRLVYVCGIRVISVTEGIDSTRDGWEVIAAVMSLVHERYVAELSNNVFRGQEGSVISGFSVGDHRFGYRSEPVPGSEQTRKGRNVKPRMTYVIDEVTAPWVRRIFVWFVRMRCTISWIARELNRLGAPKDHRSTTEEWTHQLVASLLRSPKYVGVWPWGEMKNTRDPLTGKVKQKPRSEEECEKWTRHFPQLQIVDDDLFAEAQDLLDANYDRHVATRRTDGKFKGSLAGPDGSPRHLLSGIVRCANCGATYHVRGTNGKYLFCSGYRKGTCSAKTQLPRDLAETMILNEIGSRILADPAWLDAVIKETLRSWQEQEDRVPAELAAATRELEGLNRKIEKLVDAVENGMDDPGIKARLTDNRQKRRNVDEKVKRLNRSEDQRGPAPTLEWVRQSLGELGERLRTDEPAAAYALRDLVGGVIEVTEIRRPGRKRHHLQGRFVITSVTVAAAISGCPKEDGAESDGSAGLKSEEIVIDFVEPNPMDAKCEEAKALYDQGLMNAEIAVQLGCSRSLVTKLLHHWSELHGEQLPDGRSRRSQLTKKHMDPQLYQQIADEVKRLADAQLHFGQIAEELNCDRNTVTKAWAYWHESRSLPVPDGRTRRKSLPHKRDHLDPGDRDQ
jgi:hypothetical protein